VTIQDEWDFKNAGGCANFGMYDKNPAFVITVLDDMSELMVRLSLLSELSSDGSTLITDSEHFQYCINAQVFRI
jgi:hypothetical protein